MARTLIIPTELYDVYLHEGQTRFQGCQCTKDCTCHEDFKPSEYKYYTVHRKVGRYKTTRHETMEEVEKRIQLLEQLKNTLE
jgi:hypothetical protein